MKEKIIKPGVFKRIIDLTKSRGQTYTAETVSNILSAFFDVIEDAISNGISVVLNGYMTIESQYRPQKKIYGVRKGEEITIPEHYRAYIKSGSRFNQAAKRYTDKKLGVANEHYKQE